MTKYRELTEREIREVESRGSFSSNWSQIEVSEDFHPSQIMHSRLEGRVQLDSGARIIRSSVSNYRIGEGSIIDEVTRLECRHASRFGNGVEVAVLNECGGRTVKIYDSMTSQSGYIMAVYRHRAPLIEAMSTLIDSFAASQSSTMGYVGKCSKILNSRIIREIKVGDNVLIDGVSILENGTVNSGAEFGVDVKAYNFIAAEESKVSNGATIERCFIGERVIVSNGYTATDSLLFANSHFENGEAVSIFAGPYTVSHHKSSLLIAGLFSFFNAGSNSNQSNHLLKCGAVHQAVHLRGCKFSSGGYVMCPAVEAPFTTVLGRHLHHHDTSKFPYSYLVEKGGSSQLIPALNLVNYGKVRDLNKWKQRDKRTIKRDIVNLEEHNPYICQYIIEAIEALQQLKWDSPSDDIYCYGAMIINASALERGITLYSNALEVSLLAMLSEGDSTQGVEPQSEGRWLDLGGQFASKSSVEALLSKVESGEIKSLQAINEGLLEISSHYTRAAYSWAKGQLTKRLGHEPSSEDLEDLRGSAKRAQAHLDALIESDKRKDCSGAMTISYGLDSDGDMTTVMADFNSVRGF